MLPIETHFIHKSINSFKVKEWKKRFHENRKQKGISVVILISDKIGIRSKTVTRDKEGHFILKKGSIHQEDKTTVNIYVNIYTPLYIK